MGDAHPTKLRCYAAGSKASEIFSLAEHEGAGGVRILQQRDARLVDLGLGCGRRDNAAVSGRSKPPLQAAVGWASPTTIDPIDL